jgi:hypothetical protein
MLPFLFLFIYIAVQNSLEQVGKGGAAETAGWLVASLGGSAAVGGKRLFLPVSEMLASRLVANDGKRKNRNIEKTEGKKKK